jgi:hypothetical protein
LIFPSATIFAFILGSLSNSIRHQANASSGTLGI